MTIEKDKEYLLSNYRDIIESIKQLHNEDKLFMAFNLLSDLKESLMKHNLKDILKELNDDVSMNRLIEKCNKAQKLLNELKNDEGWEMVNSYDGITTFYRHEEDTPIYSIKLDGIVDSPLLNVLSIFYEVDLYHLWILCMNECKILRRDSKYSFLCYFNWSLPFPLQNRDLLSYGFAIDMLESNGILVVIQSVESKDCGIKIENEKDFVRINCNFAGFLISPIDKQRTRVQIITNCDPQLAYMPYWLFNLAVKNLSHSVLVHVRNVAKNVSKNEYAKRIEEKEEYKDIRRRINNKKFK